MKPRSESAKCLFVVRENRFQLPVEISGTRSIFAPVLEKAGSRSALQLYGDHLAVPRFLRS